MYIWRERGKDLGIGGHVGLGPQNLLGLALKFEFSTRVNPRSVPSVRIRVLPEDRVKTRIGFWATHKQGVQET